MLKSVAEVADAFVRGAFLFPLVGVATIVGTAVGLGLKVKDVVVGRK